MDNNSLFIIKIGGAILEDKEKSDLFTRLFASIKSGKILIHGGGRTATEIAEKLGVAAPLHNGRRITNDEMMDVATMVYGGLVNKKLVARLQSLENQAIGLTGADLNLILASKRPIKDGVDYGWAGDIEQVDGKKLELLLNQGFVPVLSAITHDKKGNLLNTNADTIANSIAIEMAKHVSVHLIYLFEQEGVMKDINDPDSLINVMNHKQYQELKESELIHGGMIPKLDNAFDALESGVESVRIGRFDKLDEMISSRKGRYTLITT